MTTVTTPTSPKAFGLDVLGLAPQTTIPTALIIQATTRAGVVEGDEPAVRVPAINLDASVGFVPEGDDIPVADPKLAELVILTGKVAELIKVSREQLAQPDALDVITHEIRRSLIAKADWALLSQPAPKAPATQPPSGLLAHATDAGELSGNLDALIDVIAMIEGLPGGTATHIIASPYSYAAVRRMKKATASNESLVGAGVDAGQKTLLSVPVLTTSAMPANKIVVLDKNQVLSAYGDVMLARSDDFYFGSDNVALRATFRFGAGFIEKNAVQVLTVPEALPYTLPATLGETEDDETSKCPKRTMPRNI